jgi:hypothetical protein
MSDEKLAEANGQLAEPLPFDPAHTDQLGLLVAGQLARRHDIQITLRRNPYGGTTAIVLIPHSIVAAEGFGELEPVKALKSAPESATPAPGRHGTREQNGFAASEDTEPDLIYEGMPGERDEPVGAGRQEPVLPSYQAAPPAAAQDDAGQPALPRRVRQASLVPQVRNAPPAYPPLPGRYGDPRHPGEARAAVSAIQQGSERGRSMPGPAPGPGAPEAGESGTGHDEGGTLGAYQQQAPPPGE